MCKCIKFMAEKGYVQPNILKSGEFFLYSNMEGKVNKKTPALKINYCPACGSKLEEVTNA